jgi:hypothetical protein
MFGVSQKMRSKNDTNEVKETPLLHLQVKSLMLDKYMCFVPLLLNIDWIRKAAARSDV